MGEGEDRARLENLIEFDGLTGQMSLPGKVSNINDYYDEASLYVMTSRYEGLPMVCWKQKLMVCRSSVLIVKQVHLK